MHIHILGICGTFMGGLAALAREAGHRVTGCDAGVYPPMSDQLRALGIDLIEGFDADQIALKPDVFVIGNVVSRARKADGSPKFPLMEAILDAGLPYISGPQWLLENVLQGRHVLAVAGTHGKTTTSAMLAWVLDQAGLNPGFLIGGVPLNFGISARLGDDTAGPAGAGMRSAQVKEEPTQQTRGTTEPAQSRLKLASAPLGGSEPRAAGSVGATFVIEADEYDTAFFDKRSKFVHYRPRTAILNNLEFDHADIFPDLAAIERQFHHLVRTVPPSGRVVVNAQEPALQRVIDQGCWSKIAQFGQEGDWQTAGAPHSFDVLHRGQVVAHVDWAVQGVHNQMNALAVFAAADHVGVTPEQVAKALASFVNVKRRMEVVGTVANRHITVYDDFAHHPTAIATTLDGLRKSIGNDARIVAVFEPRSNTMKLGTMKDQLAPSLQAADIAICHAGGLDWNPREPLASLGDQAHVTDTIDETVALVQRLAQNGDHIVCMSNGGFGGIHGKLLAMLGNSAI